MRYEFTDHEWAAIKPKLPNKPRGVFSRAESGRSAGDATDQTRTCHQSQDHQAHGSCTLRHVVALQQSGCHGGSRRTSNSNVEKN